MEQNDTNSESRTRAIIIGGFAIVAVLILIGLFLPPISLGDRLGFGAGETAETGSEPAAESETAETTEFVAGSAAVPEGVALALSDGSAKIAVVNQSEFLAENDADVPEESLEVSSDVYTVSTTDESAEGQVALPVPTDTTDPNSLDLYGWDGSSWYFLPSQVDAQSRQIVSADQELPQAFALMQAKAPDELLFTGYVNSGEAVPTALLPLVTDIVISGLKLNSEGALDGAVEPQPDGAYDQWVQVSNVGPVIDQASLSKLLGDSGLQQEQIEQLVSLAGTGEYAGIELDYQQVPENQKELFSAFAANLAGALHEQGLQLAITLGAPGFTGNAWNSGGQDWIALGETADIVNIELPLDPTQYDQGDEAAQLLAYATRQINRSKLRSLYSAAAVDRFGDTFSPLTNIAALANFGELHFVQGGE